jgi:hypothetical protein
MSFVWTSRNLLKQLARWLWRSRKKQDVRSTGAQHLQIPQFSSSTTHLHERNEDANTWRWPSKDVDVKLWQKRMFLAVGPAQMCLPLETCREPFSWWRNVGKDDALRPLPSLRLRLLFATFIHMLYYIRGRFRSQCLIRGTLNPRVSDGRGRQHSNNEMKNKSIKSLTALEPSRTVTKSPSPFGCDGRIQ